MTTATNRISCRWRCQHAHDPSQDVHRLPDRTPPFRLRSHRRRAANAMVAGRQPAQQPSRGAGRHRRQRAELPSGKPGPPRRGGRPIRAIAAGGAGALACTGAGAAARRAEEGQPGPQAHQRAWARRDVHITRSASESGLWSSFAGASGLVASFAAAGGGGGRLQAQEGADGHGEAEGEGRGDGVVGRLRADGFVMWCVARACGMSKY